ncbi:hypothetical protein A3C87_01345 [Candidatus Kaiserbacteria bacterium RIFCSPHIGHO2_02_FULL_49_34]|uniref:Baseplate protein J-like domain-containing protein n=1 Tax=Candidatus Kaiserbacteria bacterium RIFCSPHIGHO2_02_FULL_49_34 TaxID=1798491 RepID=A0A1F6DMP9_9BACT|nr:MAG: hypothetical protein A3C87_01345 [Candidatus Kaiserbacteria bacterium RIFCSPHIGHO2_02_FULL_49_34]
MKDWSLQDIRPNRTRSRAEPTPERTMRPRSRVRDEDEPQEAYRPERVTPPDEVVEEDTREMHEIRTRNAMHRAAPEESREYTPSVGRPLRQKMSLAPSPVGKYLRLAAAGAVVVTAIILYMVHITATAVITVVPRVLDATVEVALTAGDGSPLTYAIITKELEARAPVVANGITDLSQSASGNITIYNEYSKEPFALTKNTRFESEGMIFRIQESAVVPGYKTDDDGSVVPGKVTAKVFADTAGEAGNIVPTQFTIPGLKSEAEQYAKLYARSDEAFTGGFVGRRAVVDEEARKEVRERVDVMLAERLTSSLSEQAVADQVMYAAGAVITYTDEIETGTSETEATLVVRGTIKAPIFSARDLAKAVLLAQGERLEGAFVITDPNALTFAYTEDVTSLAPNAPIAFTLAGTSRFVAQLPTSDIASALAGIDVDDLQTITAQYPGADRITYRMTPAWRSSFPTDPNRITIEFAILE